MPALTTTSGLRRAAAPAPGRTDARPAAAMARVEILRDIAAAESAWRRLEAGDGIVTPYERYDYLALWQRHVGEPAGVTPLLVVGFDLSGAPAFLWPFGIRRFGPLRVLTSLGGRQANFRCGLWRRDIVDAIQPIDIARAFADVARAHGVDLVALRRQQPQWAGATNPFARLPHQRSPDANYATVLRDGRGPLPDPQPSATTRRQLRKKERRLRQLDGYRYLRATTPHDVDRFLASFFALKAAHLAAQGVHNVFADPGVERFLRAASHAELADGRALIELHAIEAEGEMLALFAGPSDGERFSCLFNTYTRGKHARQSPGLVLLQHVVADLRARDLGSFDLGIGEARYKTTFCREAELLFDCFLPLSPLGWPAALLARAATAAKRRVKQAPILHAAAQRLRRGLFGRRVPSGRS